MAAAHPPSTLTYFGIRPRCCVLVTAVAVYQLLVAGTVAIAANVHGDAIAIAVAI